MLRFTLKIFFICILAGCQGSQPVKSFSNAADVNKISEEEERLWHQSERFDKALRKKDALFKDLEVTAYLQSIMDRLFPEFKGKIRVKIVKDSTLNAFALSNGSIYFHLGMLARLSNEAQLATILAHEGAHFIHKHGLKGMRQVKGATVFALGMAIAGIPVAGDIAIASIFGHSRDMEREADSVAFERLKLAGYSLNESAKPFEELLQEVKALDIDSLYIYSSHPKLGERIKSFNELIAKNKVENGDIFEDKYLGKTRSIRTASLEADLSRDRFKSVIIVLNREDTQKRYEPFTYYYLGEAYRRRGEKDDYESASYAYQRAIKFAPDFSPSYRALGIYHMKQENYKEAKKYFTEFLRLSPESDNAGYVEQYLKIVEGKVSKL